VFFFLAERLPLCCWVRGCCQARSRWEVITPTLDDISRSVGVRAFVWNRPLAVISRRRRSDAYFLTRVRLSLGYEPFAYVRAFAEAQDARVMGYETVPGTSYADPFDLRQAYVEIGKREGPVLLRTGRQEMTLGSGRLIASPEWGNVPKTFDVARGSIH
jgi:hypothetical protein